MRQHLENIHCACVCCLNMAAVRTARRMLSLEYYKILWKGVSLSRVRCLLNLSSQTSSYFVQLPTAPHRTLSTASSMCSSRPVQDKTPPKHDSKADEEDEEEEGPEYIPKRKAKNPMMKIGYAWMIGLPTGILTFILAKRQVDKNRLKQLKIRQRMRQSNEGEFEGSRYQRHTGT